MNKNDQQNDLKCISNLYRPLNELQRRRNNNKNKPATHVFFIKIT